MISGAFICGTSTEVGKTYVAALLARRLAAEGRRVGVYKPVASGCRREGDRVVADDAVALWEAAGRPGPSAASLDEVCPQRFLAPVSPHLAAAAEGKRVDASLLVAGLDAWRQRSDVLIVEGAGGLLTPLSDELYNVDLAARFGLPLIVVCDNRLGAINDTLQTLTTARSLAPGLPIAGFVLNQTRPRADDASLATNGRELVARAGVPLLATIEAGQTFWPGETDFLGMAENCASGARDRRHESRG